MERITIPIYHFFRRHKWLMWLLMLSSAAVFAFFGLQLHYEENILKLLPQTEGTASFEPVFGNLKVKDKVFIQLAPRGFGVAEVGCEPTLDEETLSSLCDEFIDSLSARDGGKYIGEVLYCIDDDMMMGVVDYAISHFPTFVDESCYPRFNELLGWEAIRERMAKNVDLLENDEDGNLSMLVGYDPLGLRYGMLGSLKEGFPDATGSALKGNATADNAAEASENAPVENASAPADSTATATAKFGMTLKNRHFFSQDGNVVMAFVSPAFDYMDSDAASSFIKMIEGEISDFEAVHPEVSVYMHGSPAMSANNSRRIKGDLVMTVGISLLLIILLIAYFFKNKSSLLLLLTPVAYGALSALALMYWIKGSMSLMAIGIGAVVLGVALSYCLHVITHYKYVNDPERVLRDESTPVFLGCLTTVGAFAGLLFTTSDLLRDFGDRKSVV